VAKWLGRVLVEKGVVTQELLEKALKIQEDEPEDSRRRFDEILYKELGVNRHAILHEVASLYAIKEISVTAESLTSEQTRFIRGILDNISDELRTSMIRSKIIPLSIDRRNGTAVLTLIAADPTDPKLPAIAEQLDYRDYDIAYTPIEDVEEILSKILSSQHDFLGLLDEIEYQEESKELRDAIDETALDAEINRSALTALIEGILVEAVRQGAADIHVVPKPGNATSFEFRIDGKLIPWHIQKGVRPEAIAAVFKDKTRNVDRFEREIAQDGFIQRNVDGHLIRYRVSIVPIVGQEFDRKFESIVVRVLDDRSVIKDLNEIGLQTDAMRHFRKAITRPSGIVLITGPTGSGKSTTLVAALHAVITPEVNVLTVEEPVEYLIEGARQLKISDKMDFDQAMRAILRHAPDIVLVGEIRDLLTAEIAMKLANTGHLTFSTLHTNDASSAVARLYKMGIEPFLIAYSVNLVMAQRLVRKLCEKCRRPIDESKIDFALGLGFTEEEINETTIYEAVGCDRCRHGFRGRIAISEALYFTIPIRQLILSSGAIVNEEAIREQAISEGMMTLRASGRERVKEGITSMDEVASITVE